MSNATGTPKSLPAASADSRRLVDSAVISKSSESDFKAGMCACAAHPRSGLAPMMPTRILLAPPLLIAINLLWKGVVGVGLGPCEGGLRGPRSSLFGAVVVVLPKGGLRGGGGGPVRRSADGRDGVEAGRAYARSRAMRRVRGRRGALRRFSCRPGCGRLPSPCLSDTRASDPFVAQRTILPVGQLSTHGRTTSLPVARPCSMSACAWAISSSA